MRTRLWVLLVMASLAAVPVGAQETRGNINGTVHDSSGVIPGATVTITNVDTGQSQQRVTNGSGYFEAPLLQPGQYRVTVDMPSYKGLAQSGILLSVGQSLTLKLTLEVGAIAERVDVTAKSPLMEYLHCLLPSRAAARISLCPRAEHTRGGRWQRPVHVCSADRRERHAAAADRDRRARRC